MKRNIYLAQVNTTFGRSAFMPYSVGLLQAYALTIQEIADNFEFSGFLYFRDDIDDVVSRLNNPDVIGISCYIWNWEYSIALAKAIKTSYPNCLVVLGGPHVPVRSENFFDDYSFVDLLVHYEGEITFSEILKARLQDNDFSNISGISIRLANNKSFKTPNRDRTGDLSILPSPYLTGVFDNLLDNKHDFHASQETNRGCPYSCTFCDWGSNIMAKLKLFEQDRLISEFDWFAKHKIEMVYNCDANYGIVARDIDLTQQMIDRKRNFSYPQKFRAAYAKNSNETVYKIATMLHQAGMNKGITLSFQSMNDNTLELVKRKNIKVHNFTDIIQRYRSEGIATYSELILGLPGENYDSFVDGLEILIRSGQHDSIQVYTCEMLPNSEMNDPEYKEKHQLRTVRTPVLFFHGTPLSDKHPEYYELIIGTADLSDDDWLKCQQMSLLIQSCHCLSLLQIIAVFLNNYYSINYRSFYEDLYRFAISNQNSIIGKAFKLATKCFENLRNGLDWGEVDQRFGNIIWPPEEIAFLRIVVGIDKFYNELLEWLISLVPTDDIGLLKDVIKYQRAIVWAPDSKSEIELSLNHNIHEMLESAYVNNPICQDNSESRYIIRAPKTYNDLETYAREVVWYGRKGGRFRHTDISRIN